MILFKESFTAAQREVAATELCYLVRICGWILLSQIRFEIYCHIAIHNFQTCNSPWSRD